MPGLIYESNTVDDIKIFLPELSEYELCIQGYFKTPLEHNIHIEIFEVANGLLAHELGQRSCVKGQELHSYETELPVISPPSLEGEQEHHP